jgi:hypothetical protein
MKFTFCVVPFPLFDCSKKEFEKKIFQVPEESVGIYF